MKFTPAAFTDTSASPRPQVGVGRSTSFIVSTPPKDSISIARMTHGITRSTLRITLLFSAVSALVSQGPGKDFTPEAKLLYRVVACTGEQPPPDGLDAETVGAYCMRLRI